MPKGILGLLRILNHLNYIDIHIMILRAWGREMTGERNNLPPIA